MSVKKASTKGVTHVFTKMFNHYQISITSKNFTMAGSTDVELFCVLYLYHKDQKNAVMEKGRISVLLFNYFLNNQQQLLL